MGKPRKIKVRGELFQATVFVRSGFDDEARPMWRAVAEDERVNLEESSHFIVVYASDGAREMVYETTQ